MKKIVMAMMLLASVAAQAQTMRDRAEVVGVREVSEQVNRPSERCWVESTERMGSRERSPVGAITGAVLGGVLGHQIGGGHGRDIATGVGVLAGAAIGDSQASQNSGPSREEVRRCAREDHFVREVTGYEVTYRYAGQVNTIVMPQRPGRFLDVDVSVTPIIR